MNPSKMKLNKNAERVAVADHHGVGLFSFSHNYNLNIFVQVRPLRGVGYAMTLIWLKFCQVDTVIFL